MYLQLLLTECQRPRDLENGEYLKNRTVNYTIGDIVSFTCNSYYIQTPESGSIECKESGWNASYECQKSIYSYYDNIPI